MHLRKPITVTAAIALGLTSIAGLSRSSAQEKPEQKTTVERRTTTRPEDIRRLTVTVKKVDRDAHKVMFEAKVSPEASISYNGQPIALDALKEGDAIRLAFDPKTGEVIKAEVVRKARK
jgi:Cu/Ag efflux protein CusF